MLLGLLRFLIGRRETPRDDSPWDDVVRSLRGNVLILNLFSLCIGGGALATLAFGVIDVDKEIEIALLLAGVVGAAGVGFVTTSVQLLQPEPKPPPNPHKEYLDYRYRMARLKQGKSDED